MRDLDNHFGEYVHLRHLPRGDEALHILRRIASCVKPIMRKRAWRVGALCEFWPDEANLLGLNIGHGFRINLRLRYAADANQFLPFDQVLDTMLHELVHIVQGEHNERFYKIWEELRDEWYTLQLKGYTGEGFLGKGQVLGGQRVPVDEARRRARASALERQKQNTLRKNPGHRLGGALPTLGPRGQHMRDVIADAVQRRNKNEKATGGCGTGNRAAERAAEDALKNGFRTRAEMDDANDAAIAKALIELMEQEEERILQGLPPHPSSPTLPSTSGGLTWDPENGLQAAAPLDNAPPKPLPPAIPTYSKPLPGPPYTAIHPSSSSTRPPVPTSRLPQAQTSHQPEPTSGGRPLSRLVHEDEVRRKQRQRGRRAPDSISAPETIDLTSSSPPDYPPGSSTQKPNHATWECPICTLLNSANNQACDACETLRSANKQVQRLSNPYPTPPLVTTPAGLTSCHAPIGGPLGWSCTNCGTFMETQWWTCSLCGGMKQSS